MTIFEGKQIYEQFPKEREDWILSITHQYIIIVVMTLD
jgi:hypothetical protein